MNELGNSADVKFDEAVTCPACGHRGVESAKVLHTFSYGDGPNAVELSATVMSQKCRECGFAFLDGTAEDAKHNAVCRHLHRLTPPQIKAIRKGFRLSRSEFAQITRLGEATLGRWERGALIQNGAYDQFLFLLSLPGNLQRIRERSSISIAANIPREDDLMRPESARFPALAQNESLKTMSEMAGQFRLYTGEAA